MACQRIENSRDTVWLWQFPQSDDFDTEEICRLSLQALIRKIGSHPTLDQKRDIALKHSQLLDKVDAFQKQAGSMLHAVSSETDDSWGDDYIRETYTGAEFDGVSEEEDDNDDRHNSAAEDRYQMQFPRNSPPNGCINAKHILYHCTFPHN
jgi:hypothetical protein